jgi:PAS domain S-box-containing protein
MQKQTTSTSRIGEDRIREAFEHAASGMAIADLEGHFEQSNPAYREMVGRTQQELDSESVLSITHPEDQESCRQHLDSLVSAQLNSFVLEKRYVRPDGTAVWVRNSFSLLKNEWNRPSHIILICNDITERRRAERLLVESEKLAVVGQLVASIAHEINNPLEAALNLMYLVRGADIWRKREASLHKPKRRFSARPISRPIRSNFTSSRPSIINEHGEATELSRLSRVIFLPAPTY